MRSHVMRGAEIVDRMVKAFGLGDWHHISLLRNIVLYHHVVLDGGGYVAGLAGDRIPPEARIVAVADIYDALTSERPYKESWDAGRAFRFLADQPGRGWIRTASRPSPIPRLPPTGLPSGIRARKSDKVRQGRPVCA